MLYRNQEKDDTKYVQDEEDPWDDFYVALYSLVLESTVWFVGFFFGKFHQCLNSFINAASQDKSLYSEEKISTTATNEIDPFNFLYCLRVAFQCLLTTH